jgi:hypothetical protein
LREEECYNDGRNEGRKEGKTMGDIIEREDEC